MGKWFTVLVEVPGLKSQVHCSKANSKIIELLDYSYSEKNNWLAPTNKNNGNNNK